MQLIVGATGQVGGCVARGLVRQGRRVRALVRAPEGRPEAKALEEAGVEVVPGDLEDPESLSAACRGADGVICTATSMPDPGEDGLRRVDIEGVQSLIDAAEKASVERFVFVSFSGNIEHDCPLRDGKRAAERRLAASRLRSVVLRPSFFMEVWLGPHLGVNLEAGTARLYGSGEAPVSYISARDVAEFAVAAAGRADDEDDEDQVVLELGGPEELSQREAIALFSEAAGRELDLEPVPLEAIRAQHASEDPLERTFGALMLAYAEGDVVSGARATAAEYGVSLGSVGEWVEEVVEIA